ncbi:hypothetical protein CKM354_000178700 [Cercospora kikuchii]|uniref:Uncharacterized protein n=1 Tax=Cercospora kikuchii TaxID=84275 RepID=A0A9P3FD17_9PEZI|nr:uncharacterized protein CKM354_000178700 [Cercospora kikuchii]GIZ38369.1 hypothetical protein CKM354_000178700 [Cercospora kikuchii]
MLCTNFKTLAGLALSVVGALGSDSALWAYGVGIHGMPLFYSDGFAYLGHEAPADAQVSTNVSFTVSDDGSFTANPVNSTVTDWTSPKLTIDNNPGALSPVSFTSGDNSSLTTSGFDLWGTLLIWVSSEGAVDIKWYAEPVDAYNRTWALKWNVDNTIGNQSIPIALKTLPPSSQRRRR